jgi:diguanylate cyclase (GGDEF)-like protein
MPDTLLSQLASVAGVRDLERLDLSLVGLLCEAMKPLQAAVLATVIDENEERWYLRARQRQGDALPDSDALRVRMDQLPLRAERPLLSRCLREQTLQTAQEGTQALSCFPLFEDPGSQGVLELRTARPLGRRELALVGSVLRFYANFRSLVRDNERDLLTGLLNRKPFDEHFDRAVQASGEEPVIEDDQRAPDAEKLSWLAVVDIDHFKSVNDRFGHLVGDEVLLLVARLMRNSFRLGDKAFRFGGEEFVLLLRGTNAEGALTVLERFRQRVEAHDFPQVQHLTVSIGYTQLGSEDTPHSAIERADRSVYVAKESGRNQVLGFERLVGEGRLAPQESVGSVDFF